ncbi:hypothetical protein [Rickettsia endosymbiont of Cantharis rufa]|uniref:hypothetical protein n=1 Tax=Rickettsia endosymbiont of Cantharis rufa TaxID=3066248 RepID=UPI0031335130
MYLPNAQIQYPALEKTFSYFDGLTRLLEFQAIISNKQDSNLIAAILQILDCIEKFASNQQIIQNYNYVLDLQIKELLLFEEMLSTTWSQSNECYSSLIEKLEAFKQTNYPSSIKNIEPKNDQLVKYYKEALDWLNKYDKPHPAEITKTKAVCYSKIGDILSEEGNYKNALANYHLTLVYNKELKGVSNKVGDMLFKLEHGN